jgi:hypothetical protein
MSLTLHHTVMLTNAHVSAPPPPVAPIALSPTFESGPFPAAGFPPGWSLVYYRANWQAVAGAISYEIDAQNFGVFNVGNVISRSNITAFNDGAFGNVFTSYYQVRAIDAGGQRSAWSNFMSVNFSL